VQTLGRMEFLSSFNPEGVEQRSCSKGFSAAPSGVVSRSIPRQFGSDHAGKPRPPPATLKGRIEEPRVQTLGRMEFLSSFNPEGLNSDPAQSSARSTYHQCLNHRQDSTKIDTTKSC